MPIDASSPVPFSRRLEHEAWTPCSSVEQAVRAIGHCMILVEDEFFEGLLPVAGGPVFR